MEATDKQKEYLSNTVKSESFIEAIKAANKQIRKMPKYNSNYKIKKK